MKFKLIIATVTDERTEDVMKRARSMGATGATVITSARGEGMKPPKSFFGITVEGQVDVLMFIVEQHMARSIMEGIAESGNFETVKGTGVVFQLDIEDVMGIGSQIEAIKEELEDEL